MTTIKFTANTAKEVKEKLESFKNLFGKAVLRVHGVVVGTIGSFSHKYAKDMGESGVIVESIGVQLIQVHVPSGPEEGYIMVINVKSGCSKACFTISQE